MQSSSAQKRQRVSRLERRIERRSIIQNLDDMLARLDVLHAMLRSLPMERNQHANLRLELAELGEKVTLLVARMHTQEVQVSRDYRRRLDRVEAKIEHDEIQRILGIGEGFMEELSDPLTLYNTEHCPKSTASDLLIHMTDSYADLSEQDVAGGEILYRVDDMIPSMVLNTLPNLEKALVVAREMLELTGASDETIAGVDEVQFRTLPGYNWTVVGGDPNIRYGRVYFWMTLPERMFGIENNTLMAIYNTLTTGAWQLRECVVHVWSTTHPTEGDDRLRSYYLMLPVQDWMNQDHPEASLPYFLPLLMPAICQAFGELNMMHLIAYGNEVGNSGDYLVRPHLNLVRRNAAGVERLYRYNYPRLLIRNIRINNLTMDNLLMLWIALSGLMMEYSMGSLMQKYDENATVEDVGSIRGVGFNIWQVTDVSLFRDVRSVELETRITKLTLMPPLIPLGPRRTTLAPHRYGSIAGRVLKRKSYKRKREEVFGCMTGRSLPHSMSRVKTYFVTPPSSNNNCLFA